MDGALFEHLSTAVIRLDRDGVIAGLNPAAEGLLGLSARAACGVRFDALVPDDPALGERLRHALDTGQPWTAREIALPLAHAMRAVTVDMTATPTGEPPDGLLLELTGLDRHLRITREESLHAQHAAGRALVRGLAHEIKNPLGGLRGAAQLLARRLDDDALRAHTRVIIDEADRLAALLDAMLGPSRPPQRAELNIHEVIERVAGLASAEAGGVRIERDYDPSLPALHGDAGHLTQAFLNLVRNAVQATGGAGTVTLRTRSLRQATIGGLRHRLALCVDVVDDGPGVPAALRDQVFFPLVTSRADGTGLGLPIAQSLIDRHGGSIECTRRAGETVFSVLLPVEGRDERAAA